jgi:gas vesicle protein
MANATDLTYRSSDYAPAPSNSDDPDVIRRQIEDTRAQMTSTISEIGERLSPDYLIDKAKTSVREATVERFRDMSYQANRRVEGMSNSMSDTVRANPLPVALIGLGLGWLIMSERNKRQDFDTRGQYRTTGYRYYEGNDGPGAMEQARHRLDDAADMVQDRAADIQNRVSGTAQRMGESVSDTASRVGDTVSGTASRVGETVSDTAHRTGEAVRETAFRVGETVGHRAEMVQERAADLSSQARSEAERLAAEARWRAQDGVQRTRQTFWETMEQNPLTLGAIVLVAGAAVGASIPSTEYENRLMGETRDKLMDEAKVRAQDTVGRVQTVLQEAQQAAVTEAKNVAQRENLPVGGNAGDSSDWTNA